MRISDWSSDVCSSALLETCRRGGDLPRIDRQTCDLRRTCGFTFEKRRDARVQPDLPAVLVGADQTCFEKRAARGEQPRVRSEPQDPGEERRREPGARAVVVEVSDDPSVGLVPLGECEQEDGVPRRRVESKACDR